MYYTYITIICMHTYITDNTTNSKVATKFS